MLRSNSSWTMVRERGHHTARQQGKRCERSYLLRKYISLFFSSSQGKGTSDRSVLRFTKKRIRKMPQKGPEEALLYSKIDSLLLPDSFCVEW